MVISYIFNPQFINSNPPFIKIRIKIQGYSRKLVKNKTYEFI